MHFKPQVPREHYFTYIPKRRWISYWYQIKEVLETNEKKVLEVGVGNKTVSNFLSKVGLDVTTFDYDESLDPDVVGDVTNLSNYFKPNSFGVILCAEVLEHLPFEYFDKVLKELNFVSAKYVVLSLPYAGIILPFRIKLPALKEINFNLRIPIFWKEHKFDGQHYWVIGTRGYKYGKIKKTLQDYFFIKKTYCPPEHPNHHFFILRTKNVLVMT